MNERLTTDRKQDNCGKTAAIVILHELLDLDGDTHSGNSWRSRHCASILMADMSNPYMLEAPCP